MRNTVKFIRKSKDFDLTQEELAKKLEVSRHTIIAIENGANTSAELMLKISIFFNKDAREIFFIENVAQSLQEDFSFN